MNPEIDILENDILQEYPEVLELLLGDHTTKKNILWATDNYAELGRKYQFSFCILPELITKEYGNLIMPRVKKDKVLQQSRLREMAEVFTPSWICNAQNNLIDNVWFGSENVFNKEIYNDNGTRNWVVNESNNIGTELNDNNQNSIVGNPATICTETYLVIGAELLLDRTSSANLSNYLRTTFARFMHSLAKISQHGTSKTYKFVPLQNFTKKSDIDWSKSISEIDQQLYSKYNLTSDEVAFIESMIKPMG